MDQTILAWLLEEKDPEVRLRTLKEYEKLPEEDERVAECKKQLLQSKTYERGLKKLRTDKPWAKYDAILGFAEWGLIRADIGEDIDSENYIRRFASTAEPTEKRTAPGKEMSLADAVLRGLKSEATALTERATLSL